MGFSATIGGDLTIYRKKNGKYVVELFDQEDNPIYNSRLLPPVKPLYQEKAFDKVEEAVDFFCSIRQEVRIGDDLNIKRNYQWATLRSQDLRGTYQPPSDS